MYYWLGLLLVQTLQPSQDVIAKHNGGYYKLLGKHTILQVLDSIRKKENESAGSVNKTHVCLPDLFQKQKQICHMFWLKPIFVLEILYKSVKCLIGYPAGTVPINAIETSFDSYHSHCETKNSLLTQRVNNGSSTYSGEDTDRGSICSDHDPNIWLSVLKEDTCLQNMLQSCCHQKSYNEAMITCTFAISICVFKYQIALNDLDH